MYLSYRTPTLENEHLAKIRNPGNLKLQTSDRKLHSVAVSHEKPNAKGLYSRALTANSTVHFEPTFEPLKDIFVD